ncbi:MAG: long-chain fatty acid--CoA ligase, partial [Cyanobacteria bacterium J06639_1]
MIYLLSQAIDESARRVPDAEAFRFEGKGVTYAELVRKANGLARVLAEQGVRKGDRVGIYLSKSLESAIALYGIWKAGAAYVPLDPLAPVSRLAFIVQNCEIRCLITQPNKRSRLLKLLEATQELECVIGMPEDERASESVRAIAWETVWQEASDRAPNLRVMEQDLAYVMYTSGSTGDPKGIMHTHKSGLSYAQMAARTYGLRVGDRLGNHSPLHFDMSTLDYFAAPLAGATTVVIPEAYTKMPASLSELIEAEALTIWYSVPFALIQLLLRGVMERRDLSSLRWVLFGGEPFPVKYLSELMHRLPEARFGNVYGPAEINQCTYYHLPPLAPGEVLPEDGGPIGEIWPNAEAFVADDRFLPVPQGDIGELLVRTPTMMTGYWRQPELSDRAFFRKTVPGDIEATYFCTGDLVQQRSDGLYQFVGRKDRQVKAR